MKDNDDDHNCRSIPHMNKNISTVSFLHLHSGLWPKLVVMVVLMGYETFFFDKNEVFYYKLIFHV